MSHVASFGSTAANIGAISSYVLLALGMLGTLVMIFYNLRGNHQSVDVAIGTPALVLSSFCYASLVTVHLQGAPCWSSVITIVVAFSSTNAFLITKLSTLRTIYLNSTLKKLTDTKTPMVKQMIFLSVPDLIITGLWIILDRPLRDNFAVQMFSSVRQDTEEGESVETVEKAKTCIFTESYLNVFPSSLMLFRGIELLYLFRMVWQMRTIKAPKVVQCFIGTFCSFISLALLSTGFPGLVFVGPVASRIISWNLSAFFSFSFLIWGNYGFAVFKRLAKCFAMDEEMLSDLDIAAGTSIKENTAEAIDECVEKVFARLENSPSFGVIYCSETHDTKCVSQAVKKRFPGMPFIGLTSVIGILHNVAFVTSQTNSPTFVSVWAVYDPDGLYRVTTKYIKKLPDSTKQVSKGEANIEGSSTYSDRKEEGTHHSDYNTIKDAVIAAFNGIYRFPKEANDSSNESDRSSTARHRFRKLDPDFVMCFTAGLNEDDVVESLQEVLPKSSNVTGGSAVMWDTKNNLEVHKRVNGIAFSSVDTEHRDSTVVLAACWPSVKTKCILAGGYTPLPQAGVVRRDDSDCGREIDRLDRVAAVEKLDSWTGHQIFGRVHEDSRRLSLGKRKTVKSSHYALARDVGNDLYGYNCYQGIELLESNVDGSVSVGANVHNGEKLTLMSTTKSQQIERVTGTITNQMKELGPLKVRGGCVNYAHSCVRLLGSDIQTFCQRMSAVLSRGAFLGACTNGQYCIAADGRVAFWTGQCSGVFFTEEPKFPRYTSRATKKAKASRSHTCFDRMFSLRGTTSQNLRSKQCGSLRRSSTTGRPTAKKSQVLHNRAATQKVTPVNRSKLVGQTQHSGQNSPEMNGDKKPDTISHEIP